MAVPLLSCALSSMRRPPYPTLLTLAVSLGAMALAAVPALATPRNKVDLAVSQTVRSGAPVVRVIITVRPDARAGIRKALTDHGDKVTAEQPLTSTLVADIHCSDVSALADHPWVLSISADATVSAGAKPDAVRTSARHSNADRQTSSWLTSTLRETLGLPKIATETTPTGAGIVVALVDSGINPSTDVPASRIVGFYDFTRGGIPVAPFDDYGHGTHIAGLVGASGALSSFELQGIAPQVKFVGFKVLDRTGQGKTSDVISALQYIVANKDLLHVQIINLSLGHPIFQAAADDPLVQAVQQATAAGLIVVTSSGNFGTMPNTGKAGYGGVTSPGNAPSAITVGAASTFDTIVRDDDVVAPYSSRGPTWYDGFAKPDVVAPGSRLASDSFSSSFLANLLSDDLVKSQNGKQFLELSGTSMAAGVTTGVVALMLDANRRTGFAGIDLSPNAVKAMLQYSAIPLAPKHGGPYDVLTQGAGEISASGAVALASAIDTSAPFESSWLRSSVPGLTTLVDGRKVHVYTWAQTIIWGDNVLSGDVLFLNLPAWSRDTVWGANVAWGADAWSDLVRTPNVVWSSNAIWGSTIIWGNRMIGMRDGDNIVWGNGGGADNIVWGNLTQDNIVWGNLWDDNIVWGNAFDNIVWGNLLDESNDNIVWGNGQLPGVQNGKRPF